MGRKKSQKIPRNLLFYYRVKNIAGYLGRNTELMQKGKKWIWSDIF